MPRGKVDFFATAHRVAQNRTVAGLHYPMDNEAGRALGRSVAEYFVHRCTGMSGIDGLTVVAAGSPAWNSRSYEAAEMASFLAALAEPETLTAVDKAGPGELPLAAWAWGQAKTALA